MSLITRILPDNPVLTNEMRVRMRGARAYWILLGYLGFLAAVLLFRYGVWLNEVHSSGVGGSEASRIGEELFLYVLVTQIFLVVFITPAITSGSVTIEKEQQTMEMLTMTRLTRRSIVVGKLLAAVSFTALLLVSSLPLVSICFMLGSIDPGMVVSTYLLLLMGSFIIGAMGLMWSSICKSTTYAVMATYGTLFALSVGGLLIFGSAVAGSMRGGADVMDFAFQGLSVVLFKGFFGITRPEGLGFAVLCLLGGVLMAAIAMTRLETWPERRGLLLRLLTLATLAIPLLAFDLWWLDAWYHRKAAPAVMAANMPPIGALTIATILLMLLVPVFATGEIQPYEARRFARHLAWGWSLPGLKRGRLASGPPFLMLLALSCLGLYALSFVLVGQARDIAHSAATAYNQAGAAPAPNTPNVINRSGHLTKRGRPGALIYPIAPPAPQAPPAPRKEEAGDFVQAAIVLLASVFGFSLMCMLFSVVFRNRWVAWMLGMLFLAVIVIGPALAQSAGSSAADTLFTINLSYFNPVQALIQMSDPNTYWNNRWLLLDTMPMWKVTTVLWLLTGALSLLLMQPFVRRESKGSAAIPYEETLLNAG
jgi:ABC-type transport system involved in multi-copper enzyme maturation permease subunit